MTKKIIIQCPQCSQQLKIPENIGGMLMACPSCGKKLYSDFKIRTANTVSQAIESNKEERHTHPPKPPGSFSVKV